MKCLRLLGISSLLATLVAAVPLDKRDIVYETVTQEVVVTIDLTTTITVTGTAPAVAYVQATSTSTSTPTPTLTTTAVVDAAAGQPDSSSSSVSSSSTLAPVEEAYVQHTPEQPVVAEPAPVQESSVETSPTQPATIIPTPTETTVVQPTAVEPSPSPSPSPSDPVYAQSLPSSLPPGPTYGSCDPNTSCHGEATVFDTYPENKHNPPACGEHVDGQVERIVALSAKLMGPKSNGNLPDGTPGDPSLLNPYCGREIKVTYGDKSVIATVKDKCPEASCPPENIDLSRAAFRDLGLDESRYDVEWHFIS